MAVEAALLLSAGRHPASSRVRRAENDARALELALNQPLDLIHAIHAGDPASPALRDYLGMGLGRIVALDVAAGQDALPALAARLARLRPGLVFAGVKSEAGEASGFVPYAVAERLGYRVLANVVDLAVGERGVVALQAQDGGDRVRCLARFPVMITVSADAPPARPVAFAMARRGYVQRVQVEAPADAAVASWTSRPAPPLAARLSGRLHGSVAARIRATEGGHEVVQPRHDGLDPEAAAATAWDRLRDEIGREAAPEG